MATANDLLRHDHVLLGSQTSNGTAVNTTTTRTALFTAITIPARTLSAGDVIQVFGGVQIGITGTPTVLFDLGVNGTAVIATPALTTVAAGGFGLIARGTVRSIGSSGTILWSLQCVSPGDIVEVSGVGATQDTSADTVDTTADITLNWYITWGTANASNTATGYNFWAMQN